MCKCHPSCSSPQDALRSLQAERERREQLKAEARVKESPYASPQLLRMHKKKLPSSKSFDLDSAAPPAQRQGSSALKKATSLRSLVKSLFKGGR
jgi:hypothetical protein